MSSFGSCEREDRIEWRGGEDVWRRKAWEARIWSKVGTVPGEGVQVKRAPPCAVTRLLTRHGIPAVSRCSPVMRHHCPVTCHDASGSRALPVPSHVSRAVPRDTTPFSPATCGGVQSYSVKITRHAVTIHASFKTSSICFVYHCFFVWVSGLIESRPVDPEFSGQPRPNNPPPSDTQQRQQ